MASRTEDNEIVPVEFEIAHVRTQVVRTVGVMGFESIGATVMPARFAAIPCEVET